jgi:hypothetical protein
VIRRILWFPTAYTIVIIVHEAAHAWTARALGLEVTLYHFWANVDEANRATMGERAAYGLAGPVSSLIVGLAALFAYRRVRSRSAAAMPLLFLTANGVSNFFGNMMSTAFIGDFSNVARWLELPMAVRYGLSVTGGVVTAAVLYASGRELGRWWSRPNASRATATLEAVVVPVAVGTAIVIAINQPVPIAGFALARAGESAVWLFAAIGAFTVRRQAEPDADSLELRWQDVAIAVVVVVVVRIMTLGIPLR